MDESGEGSEEARDNEGDDDVDIYGDLESMPSGSDANSNVIDRFNKLLCSPRNRIREEDVIDSNNEAEEDDVGLYDDLNTFEKQLKAEELEAKVELLEQKCSTLEQQNGELKSELEKVNRVNLMLRRNISSIFKTAKAELERKERQLKELQREHDSLLFRRGGGPPKAPPPANPVAKTSDSNLVLTKDDAGGNLVTIENEAECTFKMGNVTVSFSVESADFQKQRLRRLEALSKDDQPTSDKTKELGQNERPRRIEARGKDSGKPAARAPRENGSSSRSEATEARLPTVDVNKSGLDVNSVASENLEDGEVLEDNLPSIPVVPDSRDKNGSRGRRSRTPPLSNKRKRSASPERRHLRDRPAESRRPSSSNRARPPRSPISARYRSGRGRFHSRSEHHFKKN